MDVPEVSVIMTAFQSEDTIEAAVNSVLTQNYQDFELIIINDDPENNRLKKLMQDIPDSRVKIYNNSKNEGVSKSRNLGIKKSTGQYVAFIDSDDLWDSRKLGIQVNFMKKNDILFSNTSVKYISAEGEQYPGVFCIPQEVSFKELDYFNSIATSSVVVARDIIKKYRFEKDYLHEDYLMWLRILKTDHIKAYGIQDSLLTYRIQKKSKSSNKFKSIKMNYFVHRSLNDSFFKSSIKTMTHMAEAYLKYRKVFKE